MKKISLFAFALLATLTTAAQQMPEGSLPAKFKVSADKEVVFARGNLQYTTQGEHACADGTTQKGTWRIADNQYDIIGYENEKIAEDYTGYIDLFGWGTSGWSGSGAKCYQPWSLSPTINAAYSYYVGGSGTNNLTGEYAFADWGVYNAISNAGNKPQLWRTLSAEECTYLFYHNYWTLASVNGQFGFILFPTDFNEPAGISVKYVWKQDSANIPYYFEPTDYAGNSYTKEQFVQLENAGAIFLPSAMIRLNDNKIPQGIASLGSYWSTTQNYTWDDTEALGIGFGMDSANPNVTLGRCWGRSVRLVHVVDSKTALNNATTKSKAQKVVKDGQVYILRDGELFNILGTKQ